MTYDEEYGAWLEQTYDPDARAYYAFREGTQHEQHPGRTGPAHDTLAEQTDTDR